MKKLLLAASAVAMPIGLVAATGGVASAGAPKVDVSNASITCTSVTGQAKFAPSLVLAGPFKPAENTNIKLALSGCTVTGAPSVTISGGKGAGVLHSNSNSAAALLGPVVVTGQINIKWTSNVKLTSKQSSVNVTLVNGGVSAPYASLSVAAGKASVTGDFAGSDGGATSTLYAETTQPVAAITTSASSSKGLKSINLGTDGTHALPNSLHLG